MTIAPERYVWQPGDLSWDDLEVTKAAEHGHHIAGTAFTYHHGWIKLEPGDCKDGCGAKTKGGKYLPGHDAKHVSHLTAAVHSGELDPLSAHDSLAHSPKLQSKLAKKLGLAAPAGDAGLKPLAEALAHGEAEPDEAAHPAPGEAELSGPKEEPKIETTTGTVAERNWSTVTLPGGVGSVYAIEARPGADPSKPMVRDQATRFTYMGHGKVQIDRKKADGTWDFTNGAVDMEMLSGGTPFYKHAYEQLLPAQAREKAKEAGTKPAAKPKPSHGAATNLTGMKPYKQSDQRHHELVAALNDSHDVEVEGGEGIYSNGARNKMFVAQNLAKRMQVDPAAMMLASIVGDGQYDSWETERTKDIAAHPEQYRWQRLNGQVSFDKVAASSKNKSVTPEAMKEWAASKLVQTWAGTSNDSNTRSLALQEIAQDEFGLTNTAPWNMDPAKRAAVDEAKATHDEALRAFLRAQYELTQEDFAKRGVTEINVWRGMAWSGYSGDGVSGTPDWAKGLKVNQKIPAPPLRPMSSWTVNSSTATSFSHGGGARVILKSSIPAKAVLSWPRTGFGCTNEYELVCLAEGGTVTVASTGSQ
jgi:hypothetical protein